jgi:hypothetical protein
MTLDLDTTLLIYNELADYITKLKTKQSNSNLISTSEDINISNISSSSSSSSASSSISIIHPIELTEMNLKTMLEEISKQIIDRSAYIRGKRIGKQLLKLIESNNFNSSFIQLTYNQIPIQSIQLIQIMNNHQNKSIESNSIHTSTDVIPHANKASNNMNDNSTIPLPNTNINSDAASSNSSSVAAASNLSIPFTDTANNSIPILPPIQFDLIHQNNLHQPIVNDTTTSNTNIIDSPAAHNTNHNQHSLITTTQKPIYSIAADIFMNEQ